MESKGLKAGPRTLLLLATLVIGLQADAAAQTGPEPGSAEALERAKRDADKVFRWIMIHADKPRKTASEAKPASGAPAPTAATTGQASPAQPRSTASSSRPKDKSDDNAGSEKVNAPSQATGVAGGTVPALATATAASASGSSLPASAPAASQMALAAPSQAASVPVPPPEEEDDDDLPLVLVKQVEPDFPPSVMRRLYKGSVQVRFEVQPDGTVGQTEVVKTSSVRLNEAALDAVAKWRFQPLKRAQYGVVELAFNLE